LTIKPNRCKILKISKKHSSTQNFETNPIVLANFSFNHVMKQIKTNHPHKHKEVIYYVDIKVGTKGCHAQHKGPSQI
jgi:hypothetical protein